MEKVSPSNPFAFPSEKKAHKEPSNRNWKIVYNINPEGLEKADKASFLHLRYAVMTRVRMIKPCMKKVNAEGDIEKLKKGTSCQNSAAFYSNLPSLFSPIKRRLGKILPK